MFSVCVPSPWNTECWWNGWPFEAVLESSSVQTAEELVEGDCGGPNSTDIPTHTNSTQR